MHTVYISYFLMDIVSRLKIFMSSLNLTSSQFADACRIARPSLSQLLSGRNKKVSDELITKIHESFPSLSISWLLFGEGEMESASNIQFSEPQNPPTLPFDTIQSSASQPNTGYAPGNSFAPNSIQDNFNHPNPRVSAENSYQDYQPTTSAANVFASQPAKSIRLETAPNKRITNIVVFYDDNSFQSFNPS